eukprot:COSAG01_NODE_462_length_16681_cov_4.001206_17_plen_159_part_00
MFVLQLIRSTGTIDLTEHLAAGGALHSRLAVVLLRVLTSPLVCSQAGDCLPHRHRDWTAGNPCTELEARSRGVAVHQGWKGAADRQVAWHPQGGLSCEHCQVTHHQHDDWGGPGVQRPQTAGIVTKAAGGDVGVWGTAARCSLQRLGSVLRCAVLLTH